MASDAEAQTHVLQFLVNGYSYITISNSNIRTQKWEKYIKAFIIKEHSLDVCMFILELPVTSLSCMLQDSGLNSPYSFKTHDHHNHVINSLTMLTLQTLKSIFQRKAFSQNILVAVVKLLQRHVLTKSPNGILTQLHICIVTFYINALCKDLNSLTYSDWDSYITQSFHSFLNTLQSYCLSPTIIVQVLQNVPETCNFHTLKQYIVQNNSLKKSIVEQVQYTIMKLLSVLIMQYINSTYSEQLKLRINNTKELIDTLPQSILCASCIIKFYSSYTYHNKTDLCRLNTSLLEFWIGSELWPVVLGLMTIKTPEQGN